MAPLSRAASRGPLLAVTAGLVAALVASCTTAPSAPPPASGPTAAAPTPIPTEERVGVHLVIRAWTCLVCIYAVGTIVLDDGRVIWSDDSGVVGVRQLAPVGLAWVRDQLDAIRALSKDGDYQPALRPGAQSISEHSRHSFVLDRGGRWVTVTAGVPEEYANDAANWVFPPEMAILAELAGQLHRPTGWLDEAMWAGPSALYEPDRFLVQIQTGSDPPVLGTPDADAVAWPFGARIDQVGAAQPGRDWERCLVVGRDLVGLMAEAEARVGFQRHLGDPYESLVYAWGRGHGSIVVATRWLLPVEPQDCTAAAASDWAIGP